MSGRGVTESIVVRWSCFRCHLGRSSHRATRGASGCGTGGFARRDEPSRVFIVPIVSSWTSRKPKATVPIELRDLRGFAISWRQPCRMRNFAEGRWGEALDSACLPM